MHHVLDTRVGAWSVTESQVSYVYLPISPTGIAGNGAYLCVCGAASVHACGFVL